jgi:hypothetical protein
MKTKTAGASAPLPAGAVPADILRINEMDSSERMPISDLPDGFVQCAGCLFVHAKDALKRNGFVCGDCGDMVCVVCGCTDSAACDEGCWWVAPGECSTHDAENITEALSKVFSDAQTSALRAEGWAFYFTRYLLGMWRRKDLGCCRLCRRRVRSGLAGISPGSYAYHLRCLLKTRRVKTVLARATFAQ